jgi:hypothetical protein
MNLPVCLLDGDKAKARLMVTKGNGPAKRGRMVVGLRALRLLAGFCLWFGNKSTAFIVNIHRLHCKYKESLGYFSRLPIGQPPLK